MAAIRDMVVRGAPAIGIAAAYALALQARLERGDARSVPARERHRGQGARPRAADRGQPGVGDRAHGRAARRRSPALAPDERAQRMQAEAEAIHREDLAACKAMGRLGAERVPQRATILTHCNAGALATGGYGTALGVIRAAVEAGKDVRVLADETRPVPAGRAAHRVGARAGRHPTSR